MNTCPTVVLAGNPNAGKTTLFNALTGMRMQTGNFAGTTVTRKQGFIPLDEKEVALLDLPGMYSMEAASPEEAVAGQVLKGNNPDFPHPDIVLMVLDATNLERNLFLFSQIAECDRPVVVVLTMMDLAATQGLNIDIDKLSSALGCRVLPVRALKKQGLDEIKCVLSEILDWGLDDYPRPIRPPEDVLCGAGCRGCAFNGRFTWSEQVVSRVITSQHATDEETTEKLDAVLTHPLWGILSFLAIMFGVFYSIFAMASVPMDLIEGVFSGLGDWVAGQLPDGDFESLIVDGVIAGVGGILVFLPQICLLFFLLALLDDSGYLSRAAFVMDRVMKRVGLPGTAFVPLLSGHACAIPAIMSTRVISNFRDRLVTILVLPLTSCSARIPVYVLLVGLLYPDDAIKGAKLLTGAYALGIISALFVAFVLKKTILPGTSQPLLLEMPSYKVPHLRNALIHTYSKAMMFVKQAGTIILLISVLIWTFSTYPKLETSSDLSPETAQKMKLEHSLSGRLGKTIEPVIRPLGYDWQIGIGILSSFAAREVIVSTLSIIYGLGEETTEEDPELLDALRSATRDDGSKVFDTATCFSLLVFYVLAMQCLPTQAVTRAETGSWKWAGFQLLYMTLLAYLAAFAVYQGMRLWG